MFEFKECFQVLLNNKPLSCAKERNDEFKKLINDLSSVLWIFLKEYSITLFKKKKLYVYCAEWYDSLFFFLHVNNLELMKTLSR